MSAQSDYARTETTALKTQISTQMTALGNLLNAVQSIEREAAFRDEKGEQLVRANVQSGYGTLKSAVDTINGMQLSVKSQADFMAGFDAATGPE